MLQYGASLEIKDGQKKMNALQLASNQRVRETIIIGKGGKYITSADDIRYLSELKGEKMPIRVQEEEKAEIVEEPEEENQEEEQKQDQEEAEEVVSYDMKSKLPIPYDLKNHRNMLMKLLLRIQEYGITSYQHVKHAHLF